MCRALRQSPQQRRAALRLVQRAAHAAILPKCRSRRLTRWRARAIAGRARLRRGLTSVESHLTAAATTAATATAAATVKATATAAATVKATATAAATVKATAKATATAAATVAMEATVAATATVKATAPATAAVTTVADVAGAAGPATGARPAGPAVHSEAIAGRARLRRGLTSVESHLRRRRSHEATGPEGCGVSRRATGSSSWLGLG